MEPFIFKNVWFFIGFTEGRETRNSKNGKRARGINTKHRLMHLRGLPSLPSLAFTIKKETIDSSAAQSLASLGSAQLAPWVPRKGSETTKTTNYKRTSRLHKKSNRGAPQRGPDRSSQRGPGGPPREAPFGDLDGCQNVWFSMCFITKTQTCDSKNGKRAR